MTRISFQKIFRVLGITFLAALALIVITSVILSLFYEKAIVRYMRNYLDEHLLTELSMDNVQFRVFKGFPKATVEITNAVLLSGNEFSRREFAGTYSDTLLQARSILLQFNLLKLLGKKYDLKKIEVSRGQINILFDQQNRHNLQIWKSMDRSSRDYSIDLRSIELSDMRIKVISLREQLNLYAHSDKTHFKGNLTGSLLSGDVKASLMLHSLMIREKKLANESSVQLSLQMMVSNTRVRIPQGKLQLNKATATLSGEYKGGKDRTIDLTLNMPKFGLAELMSLLPWDERSPTGDLVFSGNGKLNLTVKGSLSDQKSLLISSQFELTNGTARNTETRATISNLNLKGTVSGTNQENFNLVIDRIDAKLGKGNVGGSFTLGNLKSPAFKMTVNGTIDLQALKDFSGMDTLGSLTGFIHSDFVASGNLNRLTSDSLALLLETLERGSFVFENAGLKLKDLPIVMEHISGKATWGELVRLDSISMRINETDLLISGDLQNITGYLLKRGLLHSALVVTADRLDISKYLNQPSSRTSTAGYKSMSVFPPGIYLKAQVRAKNFIAGKFESSDLELSLSALNDSVYVDHFSVRFPDGTIRGNALISVNSSHQFSITCNAQPQKINIQQLFYAFNNFTQHFIIDSNMKGLLAGNVSFFAQWDSSLNLIPGSMKAKGELEISNGELLQFEPMMKLSKYIDLEELRHIRFKTLKNTITISDRMVTIPEMAIHSSAFNIIASGQHSFDNQFEYRLKVLLSEVLFNKARKKKKEIDEFLLEEAPADQTSIPLIIEGTPNKFDVRFDRRRAFSLTRNNAKVNTAEDKNKSSSGNFRIEWEEPEKDTREEKPDNTKNKQSDFVIEWNED